MIRLHLSRNLHSGWLMAREERESHLTRAHFFQKKNYVVSFIEISYSQHLYYQIHFHNLIPSPLFSFILYVSLLSHLFQIDSILSFLINWLLLLIKKHSRSHYIMKVCTYKIKNYLQRHCKPLPGKLYEKFHVHSSFYSCAVMCINSICEWCGFHQNTLQTLFSTCSTLFWPLHDDPFCGCHTFISRVLKIPSFLSSQRAASWFIPNTLCTHTLSLQNQFLEDGC